MRLAGMHFKHPDQITRVCERCGQDVGVYPSGQEVLAEYPGAEIICDVCYQGTGSEFGPPAVAPGAKAEAEELWRKQRKN
jgi:hypothetical protein